MNYCLLQRTTFLPQSNRRYEKSGQESNLIPYPKQEFLFGSVNFYKQLCLVNLTTQNKQSFRVKTALKSHDHTSNS